LTGSLTDATSWKQMEKAIDSDRPERELTRNHQHGRTQNKNNAKHKRTNGLTERLKLIYL
jgi:hypothetical protein